MALTYSTKARLPATAAWSTATAASVSIACATGTTLLWVGIVISGTTARSGGSPTYNSVALSTAQTKINAGGTAEECAETWFMTDPPVGTYNIVVPNTAGLSIAIIAANAIGADGYTAVLDATSATQSSGPSPISTITTSTANTLVFSLIGDGANTWAPTSRSAIQLYDWDAGNQGLGAQYRTATVATAITCSWGFATAEDYIIINNSFVETPKTNWSQAGSGSMAFSGTSNSVYGFYVTYDGNAADSGSPPTDSTFYPSGSTVTVLGNSGSLVKAGYTFGGWSPTAS